MRFRDPVKLITVTKKVGLLEADLLRPLPSPAAKLAANAEETGATGDPTGFLL